MPVPVYRKHQKPVLDDSSDSEDEKPQVQSITGFDESGATTLTPIIPKGPLVIPKIPNKHLVGLARYGIRKPAFLPGQSENRGPGKEAEYREKITQFGLTVPNPQNRLDSSTDMSHSIAQYVTTSISATKDEVKEEVKDEVKEEIIDANADAITALLQGTRKKPKSTLTIPSHAPSSTLDPMPSVYDLPAESTLEDYAKVPVDQFGAAMLRGMGWIEPEEDSTDTKGKKLKPFEVVKRPEFLGIGAKPKPEDLVDDTKGGKKARRREDREYVPLVKVGKISGKIIVDITEGTHREGRPREGRPREGKPREEIPRAGREKSTKNERSDQDREWLEKYGRRNSPKTGDRVSTRDRDSERDKNRDRTIRRRSREDEYRGSRDRFRDRDRGEDRRRYHDRPKCRDRHRSRSRTRSQSRDRSRDKEGSRRDRSHRDRERDRERHPERKLERDKHSRR